MQIEFFSITFLKGIEIQVQNAVQNVSLLFYTRSFITFKKKSPSSSSPTSPLLFVVHCVEKHSKCSHCLRLTVCRRFNPLKAGSKQVVKESSLYRVLHNRQKQEDYTKTTTTTTYKEEKEEERKEKLVAPSLYSGRCFAPSSPTTPRWRAEKRDKKRTHRVFGSHFLPSRHPVLFSSLLFALGLFQTVRHTHTHATVPRTQHAVRADGTIRFPLIYINLLSYDNTIVLLQLVKLNIQ